MLPSHYEPFGIVALEAAATGAPLVTSTAGGLGEAVIDGIPGCRSRRATSPALAAAVRPVLDDPAAAQQQAVAARARLTSDFDWHTVAAETAQVYLAAKRGEREPHPRRLIVEHALPDRELPAVNARIPVLALGAVARLPSAEAFLRSMSASGGQLGALGRRGLPRQLAVLDHLGGRADRDGVSPGSRP